MAGKCMPALDFAGTRLLEPFGRTLMGLQLWHIKFPGCDRPSAALGTTFSMVTQHYALPHAMMELGCGFSALVRRLDRKFRIRPFGGELLCMGVADLFGIRSARLILTEEFVIRLPQCGLLAVVALIE